MWKLIAYMDETGRSEDPNQKFVGMAGLIATSENWEIFENQWNKTLIKFNVPYFHMKDFAHSTDFYKSWRGNETKRREFYSELIQAIRESYALPFGSTIPLEFYRKHPKYLQETVKNPYFLAFTTCGVILADLMRPTRPYGETISTVFAEQTEFQHLGMELFEMIRNAHPAEDLLDSPEFKPMRTNMPLQAADLVAYEVYKEADRRLYRSSDKPRWGWTELIEISKLSVSGFEPDLFA